MREYCDKRPSNKHQYRKRNYHANFPFKHLSMS